ncbi:MAG: hypothetical protein HYZ92_01260 [Candidatus Omnitrophica bacterium]|nr:hypothetical protein [Candidatus Omnitrophota bacterium]
MPRAVVVTRRFEQAYRQLSLHERRLVDGALQKFQGYLETGEAAVGLGLKHLGRRTHEFRAGLALRVVYVVDEETVYLALLGRHDDVQRFLRRQ